MVTTRRQRFFRGMFVGMAAMILMSLLALGLNAQPASATGIQPAFNLKQGDVSRGGYRIAVIDWPTAPNPDYRKLALIIPNGSQVAFWFNATIWPWDGTDLGTLTPFFEGNMMFSAQDRSTIKVKHIDIMTAIAIGAVNPYASGINPCDWAYAPWDRLAGKPGFPPLKLP